MNAREKLETARSSSRFSGRALIQTPQKYNYLRSTAICRWRCSPYRRIKAHALGAALVQMLQRCERLDYATMYLNIYLRSGAGVVRQGRTEAQTAGAVINVYAGAGAAICGAAGGGLR